MRSRAPRSRVLGAVLVFALVVAVGVSVAAERAPVNNGIIQACKAKKTGKLRVVAHPGHCKRGEHAISWSIRGPQGKAGLAGPQGETGPAGHAGPQGEKGEQGDPGPALASFDALEGIGCTLGSEAGSIAIDYELATGVATVKCVVASGPQPEPALVRIDEFSTGVEGAAADEFVEIVNVGGSVADLSGWKLAYRSGAGTSDVTLATLADGTTLAPGEFLLFGGSGYAGSHAADMSFSPGLASAGGGVGFRDASGALVDSVGWGTATNAFVETTPAAAPPATAAPGASAARFPDGHDTNDNSADFTVDETASPGTAN